MTTPERKGIRRLLTYSGWKGIVDRVLALMLTVLTSPIMALIALGIRLDSAGSPIFRQERVGKDGRRFALYKFRSMYVDHDDSKYKEFIRKYVQENVSSRLDENGEDAYELINDPRVTRFGVLLRKTNLDELPQLFNVLKGDMSFVGPRPDTPFAVEMYQEHHRKRFSATPGLTGLWQVSARKHLSFEDMALLDSEYIERQSLLLDTKILLLTIGTILKGNGS
jgi:lipopolysaccharide/colanic/teichoic acid biosynthesis glycosyltransferase